MAFIARPRRLRSRWALAILVLAGLVGSAAVEGVRVHRAYEGMMSGQTALEEAEALLSGEGLRVDDAALDQAEVRLVAAATDFGLAAATLGDPLLSSLGALPWVGTWVENVAHVARIGEELAEAGREGAAALREYRAPTHADGEPVPVVAQRVLEGASPHVAAMRQRLARVRQLRAQVSDPPGAAEGALARLDGRLPELEELLGRVVAAEEFLPEFFGFTGPRSYLVLAQDNTELFASGGLTTVVGRLEFDQGRTTALTFEDVEAVLDRWQGHGGEYVAPPPPLQRYLLRDFTWNLATVGWSPSFAVVARAALDFYARAGGSPVDGVIGLNFITLEALLEVTGPVTVPEYGVTVDAAHATEVVQRVTHPPGGRDEPRSRFLALLAEEVIRRALNMEAERWPDLVETMDRLGRQRQLLFYSPEEALMEPARALGWTGELEPAAGDYLLLLDTTVLSTKLNLVVTEALDLTVELRSDGSALHTLTVRYENRLPEWAATRDPELVAALMLGGTFGDYVRLLAPEGARLLSVRRDGAEVGVEDLSSEGRRVVFGRFLALPAGEQTDLTFVYEVPGVARRTARGGWEYRLYWQKQPGTRALPVRVTVWGPEGAEGGALLVDGHPRGSLGETVVTDLEEDREIVVRYEREE